MDKFVELVGARGSVDGAEHSDRLVAAFELFTDMQRVIDDQTSALQVYERKHDDSHTRIAELERQLLMLRREQQPAVVVPPSSAIITTTPTSNDQVAAELRERLHHTTSLACTSAAEIAGSVVQLRHDLQSTRTLVADMRASFVSELHALRRHLLSQQGQAHHLRELYRSELLERRRMANQLVELKGNIRVYCRIRPLLAHELSNGASSCVDLVPLAGRITVTPPPHVDPARNIGYVATTPAASDGWLVDPILRSSHTCHVAGCFLALLKAKQQASEALVRVPTCVWNAKHPRRSVRRGLRLGRDGS